MSKIEKFVNNLSGKRINSIKIFEPLNRYLKKTFRPDKHERSVGKILLPSGFSKASASV